MTSDIGGTSESLACNFGFGDFKRDPSVAPAPAPAAGPWLPRPRVASTSSFTNTSFPAPAPSASRLPTVRDIDSLVASIRNEVSIPSAVAGHLCSISQILRRKDYLQGHFQEKARLLSPLAHELKDHAVRHAPTCMSSPSRAPFDALAARHASGAAA